MQGVITTQSLIEYRKLIINEYGMKLYVRCWYRIVLNRIPRKNKRNKNVLTFLAIVMEDI